MYNWKQGLIMKSKLWAVLGNIVSSTDDKIYEEILISEYVCVCIYICAYVRIYMHAYMYVFLPTSAFASQ